MVSRKYGLQSMMARLTGDRSVKILGAGPAGLAAAITLARHGRAVQVFERKRDCGARFLGDLQGLENWSETKDVVAEFRNFGLVINFDCDPVHSIVETNGRRSEELVFDRAAFYLVKRGTAERSLDQGLKEQALAAGVEIRFRESLPARDADIVATGPVAREVFAIDKGVVFRTDAPNMAVGLVNDRAGFKGYSYLLVTGGYGCLCTVLFDRFHTIHACFEEAKTMLADGPGVRIESPKSVGGIGHFAGRSRFQDGHSLYVGEAAGLQDFLWGFGIRTAVKSGVLAAQCLLTDRNYQRAARGCFGRRLKAGVVNRWLWEIFRRGDYSVILSVLDGRTLEKLYSFYRFNPLQRLLYAPALYYMRRRYSHLLW